MATVAITPPPTHAAVAQTVGDADVLRALSRVLGRRVVSVRRQPSDFATLCAVERMDAEVEDGSTQVLFVKHVGTAPSVHPDKLRRDREVLVYERLLASQASLPVPAYFGSDRDLIALEYVDAWNLKYHGLEHWYTAAARLGDLHAHFATRAAALRSCDFLIRFAEDYLVGWARRAVDAVSQLDAPLACRLDRLVEARHPRAAVLLAQQPTTLVHNDLAPKNVIADPSAQAPARICIVDWEMAGLGCGLLDLIHLKYGLDADADAKMVAVYRSSIAGRYDLPADEDAFATVLAACELHRTLYRLAHAVLWRLPAERVAQWVEEAHQFMSRVDAGGGGAP